MSAKTPVTCAILAAASLALVFRHACGLAADSFNAKPGAWEMNVITVTNGNPIPAEVLAQLTPEKRAELEASMKAREGKPDSHTFQTCVTQKDLDQNSMIRSDGDSKCTRKVVSKSSTKIVIEQTCPAPRASTGKASIEAKTPETLLAIIDTVQGSSGKIHVDMKGRWMGASCDGIKGEE